jgi:hypothetical protein
MRAALRGLLEDADLPVIGEAADGSKPSPWPRSSSPTSW